MNILFHPAVVHLPVGLALILPLVAVWVLWKHPQAWSLLVILLGLQVAGTQWGLYTGERIEDAYEDVRGEESEPAIKEHEELAEGLLVLAWAGWVLAAGGLWLPLRFRRAVQVATLVVTIGIALQAVRTGHAGGTLVYGPDLQVPGIPAAGIPAAGVPATGVPAAGVPAAGVPAAGVPAGAPVSSGGEETDND